MMNFAKVALHGRPRTFQEWDYGRATWGNDVFRLHMMTSVTVDAWRRRPGELLRSRRATRRRRHESQERLANPEPEDTPAVGLVTP